jgi:hypothetical protein
MADTTTKPDLLGETVPADEADSLKGWTAQQPSPPPNARELPQQYVDDQLPDEEEMEKLGLTIPEDQKAGDNVEVLDPADQVRVGNPDYASPLGVTANPEGAHIPGESGSEEKIRSAPELAAGVSGEPDDSWTKAELQEYADANGIEIPSGATKSEMLDAING